MFDRTVRWNPEFDGESYNSDLWYRIDDTNFTVVTINHVIKLHPDIKEKYAQKMKNRKRVRSYKCEESQNKRHKPK